MRELINKDEIELIGHGRLVFVVSFSLKTYPLKFMCLQIKWGGIPITPLIIHIFQSNPIPSHSITQIFHYIYISFLSSSSSSPSLSQNHKLSSFSLAMSFTSSSSSIPSSSSILLLPNNNNLSSRYPFNLFSPLNLHA